MFFYFMQTKLAQLKVHILRTSQISHYLMSLGQGEENYEERFCVNVFDVIKNTFGSCNNNDKLQKEIVKNRKKIASGNIK